MLHLGTEPPSPLPVLRRPEHLSGSHVDKKRGVFEGDAATSTTLAATFGRGVAFDGGGAVWSRVEPFPSGVGHEGWQEVRGRAVDDDYRRAGLGRTEHLHRGGWHGNGVVVVVVGG